SPLPWASATRGTVHASGRLPGVPVAVGGSRRPGQRGGPRLRTADTGQPDWRNSRIRRGGPDGVPVFSRRSRPTPGADPAARRRSDDGAADGPGGAGAGGRTLFRAEPVERVPRFVSGAGLRLPPKPSG